MIFNRTAILLGEDNVHKLHNSRVAVIGLGGVGSFAVEALARGGIGKFLLIDCDVVNESNINRQLPALQSTVGQLKTEVMKKRIADINPEAEVEIFSGFLGQDNREFFLKDLDFVVDAIDSLGPKIGLLEDIFHRGIKVISVMGAGGRLDPSKIEMGDISQSRGCPLAKRVRKFLRRRGIESGIPVIYSYEQPIGQIPFDEASDAEWPEDRGRKRGTIGSIVYLTGIMGMWAASYVIRSICGKI